MENLTMEVIEVGSRVRVGNSGNSYWGEIGVVERIDSVGSFDVVTVNMEPNPEEGKHLVDFSENELSLYPGRTINVDIT